MCQVLRPLRRQAFLSLLFFWTQHLLRRDLLKRRKKKLDASSAQNTKLSIRFRQHRLQFMRYVDCSLWYMFWLVVWRMRPICTSWMGQPCAACGTASFARGTDSCRNTSRWRRGSIGFKTLPRLSNTIGIWACLTFSSRISQVSWSLAHNPYQPDAYSISWLQILTETENERHTKNTQKEVEAFLCVYTQKKVFCVCTHKKSFYLFFVCVYTQKKLLP